MKETKANIPANVTAIANETFETLAHSDPFYQLTEALFPGSSQYDPELRPADQTAFDAAVKNEQAQMRALFVEPLKREMLAILSNVYADRQ